VLRERQGIEVTDEAAKKYYDDNPKKFEQPEKVKARHILINTPPKADDKAVEEARKKAEKIAKEAQKEGTDFGKLAKEKSEGPSAKKGGDLGYFSKNRMVPGFSEKAFAMKDGEISGPVKTKFGFHIIKREGHKKAEKKSFEEAKGDIVKQLERKKFRSALDKFLKDLKKDAKIEKNADNIKVNVEAKKPGAGGGLKGLGNIGGGKGGNLKLKMNQLKGMNKKGGESGGSEESGGSAE
jgi:parvulin-like peptidyl-prolyl isomerase